MTRLFSGAAGRPVRVVFPDGTEVQGVALSDNQLELPGGADMFIEAGDVLTIQGEKREVVSMSTSMGYEPEKHPGGRPPPNAPMDYAVTTVTHRKLARPKPVPRTNPAPGVEIVGPRFGSVIVKITDDLPPGATLKASHLTTDQAVPADALARLKDSMPPPVPVERLFLLEEPTDGKHLYVYVTCPEAGLDLMLTYRPKTKAGPGK